MQMKFVQSAAWSAISTETIIPYFMRISFGILPRRALFG